MILSVMLTMEDVTRFVSTPLVASTATAVKDTSSVIIVSLVMVSLLSHNNEKLYHIPSSCVLNVPVSQ